MAEKLSVFVSHHHSPEEDTFTDRLVRDLEGLGADVWVDRQNVTHGNFVAKISEGLAGRQWLVLVMTPTALHSEWVQDEVNTALHEVKAKRMLGVIPFEMSPCDERDMPLLWRTLQKYDATANYEIAFAALTRALTFGEMPTLRSQSMVSASATLSTELLPAHLASLGFEGYRRGGQEFIIPPTCLVPGGSFEIGSDRKRDHQARDNEFPQHLITISPLRIAAFPVTVAEYACFARAAGHRMPHSPYNQLSWDDQLRRLDHPVVNVSWRDAAEYTAWLMRLTDLNYDLPSEAEWEVAARWDPDLCVMHLYPWGDIFDSSSCNTRENGPGGTTPIGAYPLGASRLGLQEMAGNVWEWTATAYKPYPLKSDDQYGMGDATWDRTLRGGSWRGGAGLARSASRISDNPATTDKFRGFRLAVRATQS